MAKPFAKRENKEVLVSESVPETPPLTVVEDDLQLTQAEIQAILAARQQTQAQAGNNPFTAGEPAVAVSDLAKALVDAINATKPIEKKTAYNRVRNSPYWPKDGSPKLRLKKRILQHGQELDDNQLHNREVEKLHRIKPGKYCDGNVHVIKRNDGALDITYPVRTAAQRLKLVNTYGITKFEDLIDRILDEKANPFKYRRSSDMDMDDE